MLPVAVLPVAGILLGVGGAFIGNYNQQAIAPGTAPSTVSPSPATSRPACQAAGGRRRRPGRRRGRRASRSTSSCRSCRAPATRSSAPSALIFAIGVALGMAKNDGVAALAATVGYLVMNGTIGVVAAARGIDDRDRPRPGDPRHRRLRRHHHRHHRRVRCSTGSTGSAAALPGLLRRQAVRPDRHGLRGHRRSASCWPSSGRRSATSSRTRPTRSSARTRPSPSSSTAWSSARCCRSACTTSGTRRSSSRSTSAAGRDCNGILTCFFRGHPESGILGGGFLVKMFGLPGAALAIWRTAKPENRARIGSIMLAGGADQPSSPASPSRWSSRSCSSRRCCTWCTPSCTGSPSRHVPARRPARATRSPRAASTTCCSTPTASNPGWS